jgi:nucleoid-associated protein YgaU
MGCVQQAVLEFDEEVQAPWRPRLVAAPELLEADLRPARPHPSRRSPSRVGVCRPPSGPTAPARTAPARPGPGDLRRRPSAPAGGARVVARRPAPGRPGASMRLTRRARRLVVVLALAAAVALGSWLGPLVAGGDGGLRLAGETSIVVREGDTLWSIAGSLGGDGDVRAVIDEIRRLNGLTDVDLVPGQVLRVP